MFHWKEFEKQGKSGINTEQAFRHWQQEETGNANHLSATHCPLKIPSILSLCWPVSLVFSLEGHFLL